MNEKAFIDFEGKKVLITGASSDIGRAVSVELHRRGAFVILAGKDQNKLKETASLLTSNNYHIVCFGLNQQAEISPRIEKISQEIGRIYGLCYAAWVDQTRPFSSYKPEIVQSILDVNLLAAIETARAICRRNVMEERGGSMVFLSSIAAHVGVVGRVGYSASKGGIAAAARSMAVELARRNIRVNCVSSGLVKTPMTDKAFAQLTKEQITAIKNAHPLGIGKPEDVARAAAFLLAPQNTWITGADLIIDGGYTAI